MEYINKTCPKCERVLPATLGNFPPGKQSKDGLATYCRPCQYAANKAWRRTHPDKAREVSRKWREANAEKEQERLRRQRLENPEAARARVRKSYYKHREKRLAARKEYRAKNLDKENACAKEYRRLNPPSLIAKERIGRKRAIALGLRFEVLDYSLILAERGSVCHICGAVIDRLDLVFDHVIPLSRGGPHLRDNIKPAHYVCNRKKHANLLP